MSLTSGVKSLFGKREPATGLDVINYSDGTNYEEVPLGFFLVQTASGKESLGYRGATGFLCWAVGETVVDGGSRVTLSVPRESLPLVRLNFRSQSADQEVGGVRIIDTDSLDQWNGEVGYDGGRIQKGVEYERV